MNANPCGEQEIEYIHILRSFVYKNHNAVCIITERGSPQPWLSAVHTPLFFSPKQNKMFCLVNLQLTGGFFGVAGFNVTAADSAISCWIFTTELSG